MIACVLLQRLELTVAAGGRAELLGVPAAVAPEAGGRQQLGEVTQAAEAFGIHPGMRLGEALSRCPTLTLIPPDPAGVAERWEQALAGLESIGARVESLRPGIACFEARGLLRMHGGPLATVLEAARAAVGSPIKIGVAPTRFAALAAAGRARVKKPQVVFGGKRETSRFLAPLPVDLLRGNPALESLPDVLARLGISTLGELAALPSAAVTDRFGEPGRRAHHLARGGDTPLRPRAPGESLWEALELPEAAGGQQLEHALSLLIDRLLARRERRGRTLRAALLSATLVEGGGTWTTRATFREALSERERIRLVLVPRLSLIPAPVVRLRLSVERFGPAASGQRALLDDPADARAARLQEAVRQARVVAGPEAALRILRVDPDSRLNERRMLLTPFEGADGAKRPGKDDEQGSPRRPGGARG
jgi:protein ImuB